MSWLCYTGLIYAFSYRNVSRCLCWRNYEKLRLFFGVFKKKFVIRRLSWKLDLNFRHSSYWDLKTWLKSYQVFDWLYRSKLLMSLLKNICFERLLGNQDNICILETIFKSSFKGESEFICWRKSLRANWYVPPFLARAKVWRRSWKCNLILASIISVKWIRL